VAFTLGDLLDLDLGLELVAGGADARGRLVVGAHSTELEQPGPWLDRDWLLLTTGLRLRHRAALQRALVEDVAGAHAAAIGFGVGIAYERVPAALLDEAGRRGLPVLAVPLETPFREVVRAVHRAWADTDALEMQRLSAMQLQLMEAVGAPAPRAAVVARLAELLNATVVLLDSAGAVVERAGEEPVDGVWDALHARHGPLAEADAGGRHIVAVPVAVGAGPPGWLAVVSRRVRPAGRLTRPAARAAAPLLAALSRIGEVTDRQDRAVRRALMAELLTQPQGRDAELRARAAELGVALGEATRVAVLRAAPGAPAPLADAEVQLAADGLAALAAGDGEDHVALLVAGSAARTRAALAAVAATTGAAGGIGRPTGQDVAGVQRSLRDARLAARMAAGTDDRVLAVDELDLATYLARSAAAADAEPLARAQLAPLPEHLRETLAVWFANDGDVRRTAAALSLRENSVRYRLGRVEALLERPLRSPRTLASLWVALALDA